MRACSAEGTFWYHHGAFYNVREADGETRTGTRA
jgi:hypothetical protein